MLILEENFKEHVVAFASELYICMYSMQANNVNPMIF